jgi:hypothetical protein
VIAADGSSARLALSLGIAKRDDRPMGVAVRRYFESPRHDDDMLESWLELRSDDGSLLPGYGWVFGVGDGTSNVGLGILNTTQAWQKTDYKELLARWTRRHARRVAVRRRPRHRTGARRSAADGLQPHAALQPRGAAGRRRRRRRQPVQRRGHRIRHGVGLLAADVAVRRSPARRAVRERALEA